MTEKAMRTLPAINAVEGFNPPEFTRQLPNDDGSMSLYMDVKYRLLWFRLHNPSGKIDPEITHVDDKSAVVCCKVYADKSDPVDQYLAKSSAQRFATQEKYGDRYLETAETAAMGRALAAAGYGTQFCGATDMFGSDVVDSPLDFGTAEDASGDAGNVTSHVLHETKPAGSIQAPASQQPAPAPASPKQEHKELITLDDYLNSMTLEDAKNVMIDVGHYSGTTLGELAIRKPGDLQWYVKNYSGRNLALKAGAILLVNAATQKAG